MGKTLQHNATHFQSFISKPIITTKQMLTGSRADGMENSHGMRARQSLPPQPCLSNVHFHLAYISKPIKPIASLHIRTIAAYCNRPPYQTLSLPLLSKSFWFSWTFFPFLHQRTYRYTYFMASISPWGSIRSILRSDSLLHYKSRDSALHL